MMYFSDTAISNFRKSRPYLFSFFIHVVLLLLALLIVIKSNQLAEENSKNETYQIDSILDRKREKKQVAPLVKKGMSHNQKSKSETMSSIPLSSLGMRLNPPTPLEKPEPQGDQGDSEKEDDWDVLNPDPRLARFNQYIFYTVQGWLDRDAYLNNQNLYGTVKVKIWFTEKGEYLEDETVYDAADPQFRLIVARALRKSFMNPIPAVYLTKKTKFSIERTVVVRKTF